jgi:antitoxin PrlF
MREKIIINERGALTIPVRLRRAFGIKPDDELIVEETEQGLLLRPAVSVPVEIYTEKRIAEFAREENALAKKLDRH